MPRLRRIDQTAVSMWQQQEEEKETRQTPVGLLKTAASFCVRATASLAFVQGHRSNQTFEQK